MIIRSISSQIVLVGIVILKYTFVNKWETLKPVQTCTIINQTLLLPDIINSVKQKVFNFVKLLYNIIQAMNDSDRISVETSVKIKDTKTF